jgi:hypothetical protein
MPADSAAQASDTRYRTAATRAAPSTSPVASIAALLRSHVSAQKRLTGLPGSSAGTYISAPADTSPARCSSCGYDGTQETSGPMAVRSP